jgi:hypothetical protein
MKHLLSTLVLFFALSSLAFAQPSSDLKIVKMTNGVEHIGTIISDDGREMLFETTTVGKIYIKKTLIKSISNYRKEDFSIVNDEIVRANPFSTRYSFTTNALPIKKKDNYYMLNLWGPEFHVAVADNFNVGVMTTWIGSPLALAAKYSITTKNPKLNFSVGEIIGNGGYIDPSAFISLSFGNVTFGDRDKNLTLGVGYGYFDFNQTEEIPGIYSFTQNIPTRSKPATKGVLGSVAASLRINDKTSFVFDSMFGMLSTGGTNSEYYYFANGSGYTTITAKQPNTPFLVLMPAIRRTQGNGSGKSVQFTLAGINMNGRSFPIPFVTWYRSL